MMKKVYDGLDVIKIPMSRAEIITASSCEAMIQLRMENGVCVSPEEQQQIEYINDKG